MKESNLLAEFETERSTWTDKEALLKFGFGRIEDMVDGKLSSFSFFGLPATDRAGFQFLASDFWLLCFLPEQTSSLVTLAPPTRPLRLIVKSGGRKVRRDRRQCPPDP